MPNKKPTGPAIDLNTRCASALKDKCLNLSVAPEEKDKWIKCWSGEKNYGKLKAGPCGELWGKPFKNLPPPPKKSAKPPPPPSKKPVKDSPPPPKKPVKPPPPPKGKPGWFCPVCNTEFKGPKPPVLSAMKQSVSAPGPDGGPKEGAQCSYCCWTVSVESGPGRGPIRGMYQPHDAGPGGEPGTGKPRPINATMKGKHCKKGGRRTKKKGGRRRRRTRRGRRSRHTRRRSRRSRRSRRRRRHRRRR